MQERNLCSQGNLNYIVILQKIIIILIPSFTRPCNVFLVGFTTSCCTEYRGDNFILSHNFCISLILAMIGVLSLLTCIPSLRQRERQKAIFYFQIPHNTLCLPLKFCKNHCFQMLLGVLRFSKSI